MSSLLMVCTGNICRSPAAELLFAAQLEDVVPVASAGTHALVGAGIPREMLTELEADEIDGTAHVARLLTENLVRDAGVIVAMSREHRQRAVQTSPSALRRAFTLAELAAAAGTGAVLEGDTVEERLASLPAVISAHRHILSGYELIDVPDPFRRPQEEYHASYTMIRGAVTEVAAWIRG